MSEKNPTRHEMQVKNLPDSLPHWPHYRIPIIHIPENALPKFTRREFLGLGVTMITILGLAACGFKPPKGNEEVTPQGVDLTPTPTLSTNQEKLKLVEQIDDFIWYHLPGIVGYTAEITNIGQPKFRYYANLNALSQDDRQELANLLTRYRSLYDVSENETDEALIGTLIENAIVTRTDTIPLIEASEESSETSTIRILNDPPISITVPVSIINLLPTNLNIIESMLITTFSGLSAIATRNDSPPLTPINIQIHIGNLAQNTDIPEEKRQNAKLIDAVTIPRLQDSKMLYEVIINQFSFAPYRAQLLGKGPVLTEILANEFTNIAGPYYLSISTGAFKLYIRSLESTLTGLQNMQPNEKEALLELLKSTKEEIVSLYQKRGTKQALIGALEQLSTIGAIILTNAIAQEIGWLPIRYLPRSVS